MLQISSQFGLLTHQNRMRSKKNLTLIVHLFLLTFVFCEAFLCRKMSLNRLEFVNMSAELFIKEEFHCKAEGSEEEFELYQAKKCGDIFHARIGKFIFCCYYCSERFTEIGLFTGHVDKVHLKPLIRVNDAHSLKEVVSILDDGIEQRTGEPQEFGDCEDFNNSEGDLEWQPVADRQKDFNSSSRRRTFSREAVSDSSDDGFNDKIQCKFCPNQYRTLTTLEEHTNIHVDKQGINCFHCSAAYKNRQSLLRHLRMKHNDFTGSSEKWSSTKPKPTKDYSCEICSKTFVCMSSLVRHKKVHNTLKNVEQLNSKDREFSGSDTASGKGCEDTKETEDLEENGSQSQDTFECQFCGKRIRLLSSLIEHERIHTRARPYKCVHCSVAYTMEKSLLRHMQMSHNDYTGSAQKYPTIRNEDGKYVCGVCQRKFSSRWGCTKHRKLHEEVANEEQSKTPTSAETLLDSSKHQKVCRVCGKHFKSASRRRFHEHVHSEVKPYRCSVCSKDFRRPYELSLHTLVHTGDRPHPCPHCSLRFALKTNLNVHIRRRHLGQKPYKCNYCDKHFVTSSERTSHHRNHTEEKPFQCEECGKKFITSGAMTSHKLRHTNTKRHKCTVCQKAFYQAPTLKTHMLVHTKEKPFKCSICQAGFTRRSAMNSHMKIHFDVKDYACKICEARFAQYSGLYSHMKSHRVAPIATKIEETDY